jgi:hypothetical protein
MATPGYPQQPMMGGPMQPMHGGPMPPMGMPPQQMRRGAPKVVPVIVSAGLAVGVFCGLLFGVGTGKDTQAATSKDKSKKDGSATKEDMTAPEGLGATAALPPPPKAGSGSAMGSGSAATIVASGSGSGSAVKAEPTIKTVKLIVLVKPENAAKDVKITIDGKDITGDTAELPAEQKTAKISLHANGFHSLDKTIDLSGDETKVELEMRPRGSGGGTDSGGSPGFGGASHTGNAVPKAPPGPPPPPPKKKGGNSGGGVIDI